MAIARTIINHSDPDAPILAVEHLTDRLFTLGYRTLNPEYRTSQHELDIDAEKAKDYIKEKADENDDHLGHFYQENRHLSKKEYAINNKLTVKIIKSIMTLYQSTNAITTRCGG